LSVSQNKTYNTLKPKLIKLWNCVHEALDSYREYPDTTVHGPSTQAAIRNDLIFRNIVSEFDDDVPDCKPVLDRKSHLRFLAVGHNDLLLWFKKVSAQRVPSNYMTSHATDILSGGQIEMFPKASIIVVGYLLDGEENRLKRLSFAPPSLGKPAWYFDIARVAKVSGMRGPQRINTRTQLVVTKGAEQIILL